jgi:hypothetical protein
LHCYLLLGKKASEDSKVYDALNCNARFWSDYNYIALQTVIIFLGKIFDTNKKAHSLSKMLIAADKYIPYFGRLALRKRKLELAGEFDGLDGYVQNAHELSREDLIQIQAEVDKAKTLWKKVEPLRNSIFAHDEMLSQEQRLELFKQVKYSDLENLIQILLNLSHALEQAELNGRRPDFSSDYKGPINVAEKEVRNLSALLVGGNGK